MFTRSNKMSGLALALLLAGTGAALANGNHSSERQPTESRKVEAQLAAADGGKWRDMKNAQYSDATPAARHLKAPVQVAEADGGKWHEAKNAQFS